MENMNKLMSRCCGGAGRLGTALLLVLSVTILGGVQPAEAVSITETFQSLSCDFPAPCLNEQEQSPLEDLTDVPFVPDLLTEFHGLTFTGNWWAVNDGPQADKAYRDGELASALPNTFLFNMTPGVLSIGFNDTVNIISAEIGTSTGPPAANNTIYEALLPLAGVPVGMEINGMVAAAIFPTLLTNGVVADLFCNDGVGFLCGVTELSIAVETGLFTLDNLVYEIATGSPSPPPTVPEPSTILLVMSGLLGMVYYSARKREALSRTTEQR